MYCKCKDNTSFSDSYSFGVGQIYQCRWYDNAHSQVMIDLNIPWDDVVLVKKADFLRCFDYWE
jgi:hypothetical protein